MKNGDWFKGIFRNSSDNVNDPKISKITKLKWNANFGFYDNYWYQLINNKLEHSFRQPTKGNEINYQMFEDWILQKELKDTQYEVY